MNNNKKQTWNLKQEGFFMGQKNSIFLTAINYVFP